MSFDLSVPVRTEEEVKNNIVLPWLRRLGVNKEETQFEHSFTLKVGLHEVKKGTGGHSKSHVGARLDTLVRRNGQNLLIVEFKAGGIELDDADRDQAISYARLLPQIAPYALVTNGRDFRLYNVVTRQRCESMELRSGYHIALPDDAIAEAQTLFLNLSPGNLITFCAEQVASHIKPLSGSGTNVNKKYVRDLIVERSALDGWVDELERSDKPGLLVLAESGRGKTSAFCGLALKRIQSGKPTLFFSGGDVEGSLLAAISDDFGWVFTEQVSPLHLVKRLGRMTSGCPLLICLDAIDEWLYPSRAASLLAFLRGVQSQGIGVKILISCKTNIWPKFTAPNGSQVGVDAYLVDGKGKDSGPERHLPAFTDDEFSLAVRHYRDAFNVHGMIELIVLDEARRNPFLLRVIFAVAASGDSRHVSFSLKDFFARYCDLLVKRTAQPEIALAQLIALAGACDRLNQAVLSIEDARIELKLSVTETILPALFEQDILRQTPQGITFCFQHLRDYLIAFRVRRWGQMPPDQFARECPDGVAQEAFSFYLRYASSEQMRALVGLAYDNAELYVHLYNELLTKFFPRLREEFEPREQGQVGFIAEYIASRRCMGGYGFRVRQAGDPAVSLVPVEEFFSKSGLLAIYGASTLHYCSSAMGLNMLRDVKREVVENEILSQLEKVVKEKRLSMRTTSTVPREAMVAVVETMPAYFEKFHGSNDRSLSYPIESTDVRACLDHRKLVMHFEYEVRAERAVASGRSWRDWGRLSEADHEEILRRADIAMTGRRPEKLRPISTDLRNLEQTLERWGVFTVKEPISAPLWPSDYFLSENLRSKPKEGRRLIESFLAKFLIAFLNDYRLVIEENFPAFKSSFSLYANLPCRLYLLTDSRLDGNHITGGLSMLGEHLPPGSENEVIICSTGELDSHACTYRGHPLDCFISTWERLDHLIPWKKDAQPVHDRIYKEIRSDWRKLANAIRRECSLPEK